MKECPNCNAQVVDSAKFCNKCGSKILEKQKNVFCIECGAKNSDDSLFCIECGCSLFDAEFDSIDFDALNNLAIDRLYENNGLRVENGVLTGYIGKKRNVVIPGSIEEIFDRAFEGNEFVSSIDIQEGVKIIGKGAFFRCKSLEKISIPSSVEKIYSDDFFGIFFGTKLDTIVLPKIDLYLIKHCLSETGKRYFNEAEINSYITRIDGKIEVNIKEIERKSDEKHRAEEARKAEEMRKKREAEAEARKKAEDERLRAEAEARRRAEEEARQRAAEEAKRRAEEEERRRAAEEARKKAELAKWVVGGNPSFGSYYRDSRFTKPYIEWIVLARDGNKALIISKYVIECISYNYYDTSVTWETCSLRKWLNNDFLSSAFSYEERSRIKDTCLQNPGNMFDAGKIYRTEGGNPTSDKVFILSEEEFYKYSFPKEGQATEYAKSRGVHTANNGNCLYWVRKPGSMQNEAMLVDKYGSIWVPDRVNSYNRGVRPAMWVSLE